ncbi:restriction endonuclease subunit S [Klebsiella pneumoniae]|uniref:restriction endonuclease subunit S n=1 Tax=Klebsiella pneumoniae TaxID=573 RepID=UPI0007457F9B|nr:restriction endonuclease subunit S [Klebsiella pneumoniae]HCB1269689.1 restriction endonuclease subunit S [Klebsiella quasipneumoniae subsp. quasipneumoniae]AMA23355.1 restriction endonuclease subunit S [Klebsiella pneumoniae subsp. pneumoniae]MBC5347925.1 restriction endonuclease subunit S [Klebsiella pneumoniae]MBC5358492.1 restriction endonuclease subunit S [Klebsiella pneumoniae]HCR5421250.1 restriction endonuclease subunit S [Klebsiella pneumoniae]
MTHSYMTTIGEIAEVFDGPHATPKKLPSGPYFLSISSLDKGRLDLTKSAFLSEEDFKKWTKRVTPEKGDLLFSYETRLGEAALMPAGVRACLGRRMGLLRFNKAKAMPEYVLYAYLSPAFQQTIKANTLTGATVDRLSISEFPNFPIRIPPLEEQKKVANLLGSIDKKIALNNRINAELEAIAKTLYDYWFVQFDFPDANGKPYKTSGGKMEYNATLKREVPVGWKIKKISEIALVKAGGDKPSNCVDFRSDEYSIPIFSNGISSEGLYGYTNISVVNKPSITVSARGTIGYSVLRLKPFFPIIRLLVLTPYQDNALKFLEETIKRFSFENSGSVQQQLTVPQISEMSILYPIEKLLNIYTKRIWPLIKKIELIKEQNSELQQLRDWLLPLLMNGQVTIK